MYRFQDRRWLRIKPKYLYELTEEREKFDKIISASVELKDFTVNTMDLHFINEKSKQIEFEVEVRGERDY